MTETLLASGTALNWSRLGNCGAYFKEGEKGHVAVSLRTGIPSSVVSGINAAVKKAGVNLSEPISQASNTLHFRFTKDQDPFTIFAVIVAAAIAVVILVVAWKVYKLSPTAVATLSVVWLGVIAAGAFIAVKLFKGSG